jgi:hypothetical protein
VADNEEGGVSGSASIHEHLDNPGVMIVLIAIGVLAIRKGLIYAGTKFKWPALVGFAQ